MPENLAGPGPLRELIEVSQCHTDLLEPDLALERQPCEPAAGRSVVVVRLLTRDHEALLEAQAFEDLAGKWQAAMLEVEKNRPELQVV